ncbi:TSCPD domain-containing protein [Micromonospora craniellae]|uniref:ribonucleoside-diphosphate reductase n=1 Tax=Micromonospora craniellae TaxID=2294034 RepID=A0A372FRM4_9ACTN|nr:hypothetical protein [Micromonospora craniellae]QOC93501.1 hypothetical protein ID554_07570 [Micromonospora craniellae]RFS43432.1 hypothetical protein D0Q02_27755 [Micromonospora craniellae]
MTSTFVIDGVPGRLVTTATSNGEVGHVDLRAGTHNSTLAGLTDALSTAITTALRAGAPSTAFVDAFRRTRYVPAGATGDPHVPHATSLGDYLAQRLHHNHPDGPERP